jgi:hypothetical protein
VALTAGARHCGPLRPAASAPSSAVAVVDLAPPSPPPASAPSPPPS